MPDTERLPEPLITNYEWQADAAHLFHPAKERNSQQRHPSGCFPVDLAPSRRDPLRRQTRPKENLMTKFVFEPRPAILPAATTQSIATHPLSGLPGQAP